MARLTDVPAEYDAQTFRQICRDLEGRLNKLSGAVGSYQVSNFTRVTSLDMGAATATDIGNFLCTLVQDLQKAGRLGA